MEKGEWLFTCAMEPKQFSHFERACQECGRHYPLEVDVCSHCEIELNRNTDDFETLDGSCHSVKHCSCSPISEGYAKFFIKNKLSDLYEELTDDVGADISFDAYREKVKGFCKEKGITFEGI